MYKRPSILILASSLCTIRVQRGLWGGIQLPKMRPREHAGQGGPSALPRVSPPLLPPRVPRRDTKAILSVLISSALHVFGKLGQLCGRLAEFQEVDVFLGFDSSLFALDEVATQESPFASPRAGKPQDGGVP